MKNYTYHFTDGTTNTIEVTDEMYDELKKLDDEERKQNYNYNRHNTPLSMFSYDGEDFADPNGDMSDILIFKDDMQILKKAIVSLSENQARLVKLFFIEKKTLMEIASIEGVSFQAIADRLKKIYAKLKKFWN